MNISGLAKGQRPKANDGQPLSNHQFAAALRFEGHGFVKSDNGALGLIVGWRLGGDALQPQSGSRDESE